MGTQGDVYKVISKMTYLGQECVNIYHYMQGALGGDAAELADEFDDDVITTMLPVQHTGVVHEGVEVINLDDVADFATLNVNRAGTNAGIAPMPSFVSWSFRLDRATRSVRNGGKRIVGVCEESTSGNSPIAAIEPTLAALAADFAKTLVHGTSGAEFIPVIVRRNSATLPDATVAVAGASFVRLSTQNSRKA